MVNLLARREPIFLGSVELVWSIRAETRADCGLMIMKRVLEGGRTNGCPVVIWWRLKSSCNCEGVRCADKETLAHSENACESRSHSEDSIIHNWIQLD